MQVDFVGSLDNAATLAADAVPLKFADLLPEPLVSRMLLARALEAADAAPGR